MKLFNLIATSVLGMTMAIGVGLTINNQRNIKPTEAATENFTLSSASSVTKGDVTVSFAKGNGSTAPTWYDAGLRLYASNTVTLSSSGGNISSISFDWEKQGKKDFASVTASVGTYTHPSNTGTGSWTGDAASVVFTLGNSGQLQLNTFCVTTANNTQPGISLSKSSFSLNMSSGQQVITVTPNANFSATPTLSLTNVPSCVNAVVDDLTVKITPAAAGNGEFTITATNNTEVATAKVTVSVSHGITEDDPLSVSEAIAAIDGGTLSSSTTYYVAGLYVSTQTAWNTSFKNVTYNVTDSNDTSKAFQFYRMGATADPGCGAGDYILVSCVGSNIVLYGSTYECSTCTYVSHSTLSVPLTGIEITAPINTVKVGKTLTLSVRYTPSATTDSKSINWSSSDTAIASVSNGVVTGVGEGDVIITATSVAKPSITDTFDVTVTSNSIEGTYLFTYNTATNLNYSTAMTTTTFKDYVSGFDSDVFTVTSASSLYANNSPKATYFSFGGHGSTTSEFGLALNETSGYAISKVVLGNASAIGSETPSVEIADISYDPSTTEKNYSFYPFAASMTMETTTNRLFFETIAVTVIRTDNFGDLAIAYADAFIDLTGEACSAGEMTNAVWLRAQAAFNNLNTLSTSAASVVKTADESVNAVARYKFCIEKYGTAVCPDFLEKGYTKLGSRSTLTYINKDCSIIVVISVASCSISLVGLFFTIRKRKVNR